MQVFILLDRSGSMRENIGNFGRFEPIGRDAQTRWQAACKGINAYVRSLAGNDETAEAKVTLFVFDSPSVYGLGETGVDLVRVQPATKPVDFHPIGYDAIQPRGGTPLFDAIGEFVAYAELQARPEERVVLLIDTDGEENSSRRLNKLAAKEALDRCRARGWQVVMLGTDFENFHQASSVGNAYAQSLSSIGADGKAAAYNTVARETRSFMASGQCMSFTDEDRADAGGVVGPIPRAS